jgi:hypothetical protein
MMGGMGDLMGGMGDLMGGMGDLFKLEQKCPSYTCKEEGMKPVQKSLEGNREEN